MADTTIRLIRDRERYQDAYGIWRTRERSEREVLAQVSSVDRREFFSGGETGFRPEYRFVVFAAEYQGETQCEYDNQLFSVYRTYLNPGTDYLELYVQRKVGVGDGS